MTTAIRPVQAPQTRPCAECPTPVPHGTTYCSTRCRNAADDHNDYGDC
jgi:predicted nucleic acid-binding Zn ribbon protein